MVLKPLITSYGSSYGKYGGTRLTDYNLTGDINQDKLNKTLMNLKAKSMVVGHTVQKRVNSLCNGKLWRVDTGMSRAFGENNKKRMGFLLILENGKKTKIF